MSESKLTNIMPAANYKSTSSDPVLGCALATLGSFLSAISFIFMKMAHLKVEKALQKQNQDSSRKLSMTSFTSISEHAKINAYMQPLWWIGFIGVCLQFFVNSLALGFASVILLSSTGCFTLIFNSILTPLMLGEVFHYKSEIPSMLIIILGCTLCLV